MRARLWRLATVWTAGMALSGLIAMALWTVVRNDESSQCYGLITVGELGVATFYTFPVTSIASHSGNPWLDGLCCLGVPVAVGLIGVVAALRKFEMLGYVFIIAAWLAYGVTSAMFIVAGC